MQSDDHELLWLIKFPDDQDMPWNKFEYEFNERDFFKNVPHETLEVEEATSIPVGTLPTVSWIRELVE